MYTLPCILFAGGKSSRMGENKALLPFAGKSSLAQYQYERLNEIFEHIYIGTKEPQLFDHINASFIDECCHPNIYAPTVGFVSAFKQLKTEKALFVLSVDAPFVSKALIDEFLAVDLANYDAIIARTSSGIHPLCGIYSRSLELSFYKMIQEDNHKLGQLLKNANVLYIDVEDEGELMNVNTPDEYQKALKQLTGA